MALSETVNREGQGWSNVDVRLGDLGPDLRGSSIGVDTLVPTPTGYGANCAGGAISAPMPEMTDIACCAATHLE
jgi:hypothetical protein